MTSEQNMQYGKNVRRAYGHNTDDVVNREASVKDILGALQDISFLDANSASPSVVIMGKLRANPEIGIFLKIFKDDPTDETYAALRNEYNIYNELYKLREVGVTPNLLARVGTFRLTAGGGDGTFYKDPYVKEISNYDEYFHVTSNRNYGRVDEVPDVTSWTRMLCIMTCSVEYSFRDCFRMNLTYQEFVGLYYQIAHLYTWFEHIEMAHHDLHTGNIRVEYHETPLDIYYQHKEGECVCVTTRFVVKIYDFDRSSIYKQTDLGRGRVVQKNLYKNAFKTFNSKEDYFYLIVDLLGLDENDDEIYEAHPISNRQFKKLADLLVPGYAKNAPFDYKLLSGAEKKTFENITNDYKKYEVCKDETVFEAMVEGRIKFKTYVDSMVTVDGTGMISYPHDRRSYCSVYIPDSIILPFLQMLDVMSGHKDSGMSIVPIQKARNSGQPIYPTPNIYYAM